MEAQADKYRILFSGQTLESFTLESAKSNLRKLLKTNEETIERLFSGNTVVIKKDLDRQTADKYVATLNRAGLDVRTDPPLVEDISIDLEAGNPLSLEPKETVPPAPEKSAAAQANPYSSPAAEDLLPSVHCRQCGASIGQNEAVCSQCGAKQPIGKPRSKVAAGLFAIFLGWLGVHRFYLGQWWGIFYFLLGFLAWPIAIIEGIVFLATPKSRWDAKYANTQPLASAVLIIVGLFVFIAIIGILAAIAIPQYMDYVARAKIHEAMPVIEKTRDHVESYIVSENALPNSNRQAGLPETITGKNLLSIEVLPDGVMRVTFKTESATLNEKTMEWVPELRDGRVYWDCSGGDVPKQYRPKQCREGKFEAAQRPASVQRLVADNGLVDLVVPQSWKPMELGQDAIIQVGNPYSEAYLMVYNDPRIDLPEYDLKGYADAVLEIMAGNIADARVRFLENAAVNGLPALHYRIDGKIETYEVAYLVTIVQSQQQFYQLVTWSLLSRLSGNEENMAYAIASFREREPDFRMTE